MESPKKKVLVGMSGGIDSTVTAFLLKEQGYDVIGIHLRFWVDPTVFSDEDLQKFPQNKCCTLDGLTRTRMIAHNLGIPFYVLNFEDVFKEKVVDFFVEGYAKGVTPNPCVECNRNIKFGFFLEKMKELGADYIATGHYAQIKKRTRPLDSSLSDSVRSKDPSSEGKADEIYELWMSKDHIKDQTYFLYTLTQEKLKHVLFPIGEYTKPEVRELARKFGIEEVTKIKESQNLCFYPEQKPGNFLKRHIRPEAFSPGPIITVQGERIGTHAGLPTYTIGQRKGLGIGGVKGHENDQELGWYVVKIDQSRNALIVGKESDLYTGSFEAHTLTFVDGKFPEKPINIQAKIRSLFPPQKAVLTLLSAENQTAPRARIEFEKPQRAVTSGQSVVFYDQEKVIGGGIIQ